MSVPTPITERAIGIIDAAPNHGPLNPIAYAEALPLDAGALAELLRSQEVADAAAKFHEADRHALRAQKQFMTVAWTAAYSGFFAAVVGGVLLYMGSTPGAQGLAYTLGVLQFVALAISLSGSLVLYLWKPFRTWRIRRGEAEVARIGFFSKLIALPGAPADELLLPLKLECFRRHLLEDQRYYFGRRGREHRRTVRGWNAVRVLALLLILAASMPLLALFAPFGWLPEAMRKFLAWLPLTGDGVRETYALAGLVGASLQGLMASLSSISLAERNAERFETMKAHLAKYLGEVLADVRDAAAQSLQKAVETYVDLITADLLTEAGDWGAWHEARSEMAVKLLAQHKVTP